MLEDNLPGYPVITITNKYDRRALTVTSLLPLTNSLFNLSHLSNTCKLTLSCLEKDLDLLVSILVRFLSSNDRLSRLAFSAALSSLANIAISGNFDSRSRLADSSLFSILSNILNSVKLLVLPVGSAPAAEHVDQSIHVLLFNLA